jgi:hypothetical protein
LLECDVWDAREGKSEVVVLVFDLHGIPVQYVEVGDVQDPGKSDIEMICVDLTVTAMAEPELKVDNLEVSQSLRKELGNADQLKKLNGKGWKHLHVKGC